MPFAGTTLFRLRSIEVQYMDRREARRYPRAASPPGMSVALQCGERREVSPAGPISLSGLFLRTEHPIPAGRTLKLFFAAPGCEVRAGGIVRHTRPGQGMGIEFLSMHHTQREHLFQLMKRLAGG